MTLIEALRRLTHFRGITHCFSAESPCTAHDTDDSDDPDEAQRLGLKYVMGVSAVQDIIANAKAQKADADLTTLLQAFNYYYAHDAFPTL